MLWYFLLSKENATWEQRIGSFFVACQGCGQAAWQLAFRLYQTEGSVASPATPYGFAVNERFQIRCATCGCGTTVGHPSTWVGALPAPFQQESYPPSRAVPQYVALTYR